MCEIDFLQLISRALFCQHRNRFVVFIDDYDVISVNNMVVRCILRVIQFNNSICVVNIGLITIRRARPSVIRIIVIDHIVHGTNLLTMFVLCLVYSRRCYGGVWRWYTSQFNPLPHLCFAKCTHRHRRRRRITWFQSSSHAGKKLIFLPFNFDVFDCRCDYWYG